ncbi:MAG: F0F1 ATP synthase subunit delta [Verrucomicrobiota bacterium]
MANADQPIKDFAKKLVTMSLDSEGQASSERVKAVLDALGANPPRRYRLLLKFYARYLAVEISRGQAKIDYAGPLGEDTVAEIEKKFTAAYDRRIVAVAQEKPELIAGVRVTIGDDVYDSSVATRLAQLEMNVS